MPVRKERKKKRFILNEDKVKGKGATYSSLQTVEKPL